MNIITILRQNKRRISFFLLISFISECLYPSAALALTSGPSQPEVQEFQSINVSDMVDPSSGDFSYNIPLIEVDGYPVNLSYRAGITMDQEATCVGLGWNLNCGSIARNLRGIPDDFSGEEIVKKMNMKVNESYGLTLGVGAELFGTASTTTLGLSKSWGITYNNYNGYDFIRKMGFNISLGDHASVGFGITSSGDGLTIAPNLNFKAKLESAEGHSLKGSASLGTSFNSRVGIRELSLNASLTAYRQEQGAKDASRMGSINPHTAITFGSPTYVPQITMPMKTTAVSASFKLGGTVFGIDGTADLSGNYTKQQLAEQEQKVPAYGYLNLHEGQNTDNAMLDFNREKDGTFTEATPVLPIPNLTYDNYSVMGQGVGGSYRPFRSDLGYVFDSRANTISESYNLGAEASIGNVVQAGLDFVNTTVTGSSGLWIDGNAAMSTFGFGKGVGLDYEPSYFKEMGEMNIDDDAQFSGIKDVQSAKFRLIDMGYTSMLDNQLESEDGSVFSLTNYAKRTKRVRRNQLFSQIKIKNYQSLALQSTLFSQIAKYDANNLLINGEQIGQITTTKTDGTRYVYGLPVFNNYQKEATFNVSGNSYVTTNGMVAYSGTDASIGNSKGTDNFFSSTEMPAYAYAHLLTAVLSSDYVDKSGNGPSEDDLGNYTLFTYNTSDKVSNYEWRAPHSNNQQPGYATLDEGNLTNSADNKGSFVYGKKDINYLSKIEGKNHVAILTYSNRSDGLGVSGEAGGLGNIAQKRLESITVYSKSDLAIKISNPSYQPTIIKKVNFVYDYSLCSNTYNSSAGGKLTLKEVYFTFGKSFKGKLSPYKFNYNTSVPSLGATAPNYNPTWVDRWGNFKPNDPNCPNSKFPYVVQDKIREDQYISLWNLKTIQLPSGGVIEVQYESDDYGYIQDKRAGEMFKVVGFDANPSQTTLSNPSKLFLNANVLSPSTQTYLYFKLKPTASNYTNVSEFLQDYIADLNYIYFRFYTKVNCGQGGDAANLTFNKTGYEFIHGYFEIDKSNPSTYAGTSTIGGIEHGWIKVRRVPQSKVHQGVLENPISKAAWQFARTQTPKQAYSCIGPDPASNATGIEGVLKAIANSSFIKNTIQTFKGYNGTLKTAGSNIGGPFGQDFEPSLSWIRLQNPDGKKLGGGHRVKTIKIYDNWDKMLSPQPFNTTQGFSYGQNYDYSIYEGTRYVSTGVASYEPSVGGDENSFRQPIFHDSKKSEALLAPDMNMYSETPLGESFFPSPSVVYSRVEVTGLVPGTGKTINEYYTSKDFPTLVRNMEFEPKRHNPSPIAEFFSFSTYDRFFGSSGYSIELNDMHGKPKKVSEFEEGTNASVKEVVYNYRHEGNQLRNTVKTVMKDGTIKDAAIGIDYDFYADFRDNSTFTESLGMQGNAHFFMIGLVPMVVPMILPTYHSEEIQVRTAVTNKVIYKYGILESVESFENGNSALSKNELWDAETGKVILTSTATEFKDPIFNVNYPGHWAYEGLAGGYKNTGVEFSDPSLLVNASTAKITDNACLKLIADGDEIGIISSNGTDKGYILKVGQDYYFTKNTTTGNVKTSTVLTAANLAGCTVVIVRSGRHNLQDTYVGSIKSFTSPLFNNPTTWPIINENYGVTAASAVQLGTDVQGYCGCDFTNGNSNTIPTNINPFVNGLRGSLRQIKEYTYLTERKQTKIDGNSNIRIDGTFEKFNPFYNPNAGNDWYATPNNWTWSNQSTRFSPFGFDVESKDALERKNSAQYGYKQTLPVAIVSNSSYKQSANENFEYSDLNFCEDNHFGFNQHESKTYLLPASAVKTQKYAHSGKRSLSVAPNSTVTVNRQINPCN